MTKATTLAEIVQQCGEDSRAWFPKVYALTDIEALAHHALAACGEAGELANNVKKVWRGSRTLEEAREDIVEEAMDVFIYVMNVFEMLGIVDPVELYNYKRSLNVTRFASRGGDQHDD